MDVKEESMEYEYVQMTLDDWMKMKEQLKEDLIGVQESFVRIGFLLRQIKEQELYKKDGYATIAEFAKAEYGLEAPTVSRFIKINERYSVDGYSDRLRPEYARMGSSKLAEMLSLPDGDLEMIKPEATRENIRELKQFNKTEPAAGDEIGYRELVESFFRDNPALLKEIYTAGIDTEPSRLAEIVNPGGNRSYRKGMYFLMMYENDIKVKKFGSSAPGTMSWAEFFALVKEIYGEELSEEEKTEEPAESESDETETKSEKEDTVATPQPESDSEQDPEPEDVPAETPEDEAKEKTDHIASDIKMTADDSEETEEPELDKGISDIASDEMEEEIAPAQFSAESLNKDSNQEPEKSVEIPPETVRETAEVMKLDPDLFDQSERPQEELPEKPREEPAGQQAPIKVCSRKQYIDGLTAEQAARYISNEYCNSNLTHTMLLEPKYLLKNWLNKEVDEAGNGV